MTGSIIKAREAFRTIYYLLCFYPYWLIGINKNNCGWAKPVLLGKWSKKAVFLMGYNKRMRSDFFIKAYSKTDNREVQISKKLDGKIQQDNYVLCKKNFKLLNFQFLIFEYKQGVTLEFAIKNHIDPYLNIFLEEIGRVLIALSEDCVVHCDMTPANIIILKTGSIVLIDFEFALITSDPDLCNHTSEEEKFLKHLGGLYRPQNKFSNEGFVKNILRLHRIELEHVNRTRFAELLKTVEM